MNTSIEFFLLSLIFSKPKPSPSRTPTIAAGRDLPEPRRGHHRHHHPRHAQHTGGIEPISPGASPTSLSSPTTGDVDCADSDLPLRHRQALRDHGELLMLKHPVASSTPLCIATTTHLCVSPRSASPAVKLR
jgi:hypothetical protein